MKISFTGTQSGMTPWQENELGNRLQELNCSELVNGGCIGADEGSILIALQVGVRIFHLYPSYLKHKQGEVIKVGDSGGQYVTRTLPLFGEVSIKIEKEMAPLVRNQIIVDESDILIAAPKEHLHTLRSGTWATVRYAWKRKKKVIVIPPIEREEDNDKEGTETDLPPAS